TVIHLKAPSIGAVIDQANDYTLATATKITGIPTLVWDIAPADSSTFALLASSTSLKLHYGAAISGASTTAAFTTTYGTASANQSFFVSGANLTDDLVATAGTGFEVATSSGGPYGSSVTFNQTSGSASGTVFVRLTATTAASSSAYNSVNAVVLSST